VILLALVHFQHDKLGYAFGVIGTSFTFLILELESDAPVKGK
jgi:hypothetical protein